MAMALGESCSAATFSPVLFGAEILAVQANLVTGYNASIPELYRFVAPAVELRNASFCNVTVSYTHPGQNDKILVEAWLPPDGWNGRFHAIGGGGWAAGRYSEAYGTMGGALADGFATITTDAGLGFVQDPSLWALLSPGNINWYNLQNLASVSLNDMAIIGKSLIESYYGQPPKYSYFSGCSQGGRQALMLAQRYPEAFDGIAAGAPAIYWADFFPNFQWPQQVMNELGEYPYPCEIDAITAAAVSACDGLDGTVDGVIAHVDECFQTFDPLSVVGTAVKCKQLNGSEIQISEAAATIVNATWQGMTTADGRPVWYGLAPDADLTGSNANYSGPAGIVATNCTNDGCVGTPLSLGLQWLQLFVARDAKADLSSLSRVEFDNLAHAGRQMYDSVIGTADPDLTSFRNARSKLITFHGLADNLIPPGGTAHYYDQVSKSLASTHSFFRHFEIPGLAHCGGGASGLPNTLFSQLQAWVENGVAPDQTWVEVHRPDGRADNRTLYPYSGGE